MQATPLKSMQFLVQKAEQHQAICVKFQASLWVNKYGVFARQVKGLLIFLGRVWKQVMKRVRCRLNDMQEEGVKDVCKM